jgi:CRISPR system Cascade subunit CasE
MYLSKLTICTTSPQVLRALGDLHALHRLVLRGFPDAEEGGTGRVLYRLESRQSPRDTPTLIVQSEKQPDWSPLKDLVVAQGPKVWEPEFSVGQKLQFRLRATPTKKTFFGPESRHPGHRRVALTKEQEQRDWFLRKASEAGFEVLSLRLTTIGWQGGQKSDGANLRHHGVDFEGVLTVTDPVLFAEALAAGIGAAKGFGFGLLSVARA